MSKIFKKLKPLFCLIICIAVCITFFCTAFKSQKAESECKSTVLNIWQIDSFEGGKGSRAEYLKYVGEKFSAETDCFINVTSISADAARLNISKRNYPDLISYGAGMYGIENIIDDFVCWCHGGYCILSLDTNTDFSDVNESNTVINGGKDNYTAAAAMFCGIAGAKYLKPTSAYLKLISSEYKYLLGTQRDIFRLKTRKVNFVIKAVTEFNDLYQNISVTTRSKHIKEAQKFIEYLLSCGTGVDKIGMMFKGAKLYGDEMKLMEEADYKYKLTSNISLQSKEKIDNIISSSDINMLKNLFN